MSPKDDPCFRLIVEYCNTPDTDFENKERIFREVLTHPRRSNWEVIEMMTQTNLEKLIDLGFNSLVNPERSELDLLVHRLPNSAQRIHELRKSLIPAAKGLKPTPVFSAA